MELFLIYLITRLTDIKGALSWVVGVSGVLLAVTLVVYALNEVLTEAKVKAREADEGSTDGELYMYKGAQRVTKAGLRRFVPIFVVAFTLNLFLPNTRDAVVIAGGYGLVEAVKNERVQRLFGKSATVASQWLDEQLNGEKKKETKDKADKVDQTIVEPKVDQNTVESKSDGQN